MPIVDSFVPPDFCTKFAPARKRVQASEVHWPDARRVALLRLLAPPQSEGSEAAPPPAPETETPEELPSDDEQWLL
jgi:hypothetical protein